MCKLTCEIGGEHVVMVTQFLAAVPAGMLNKEFDKNTTAVNMLMQDF